MTKVAVVGHVEWVDFIPLVRLPERGEVMNAGTGAFARPAGGGGVVAVVLAELGADVDFFCALGEDAHGRATAEQLAARGVTPHVAWRPDRPTRRAVTLLEPGERTIITVGERLAPSGSDPLDWGLLAEAAGVFFTAGDAGALRYARTAGTLVATPRARHTLEHGPELDALVFSRGDRDESSWAQRLRHKARLFVETRGAEGGVWSGQSEGSWAAVPPDAPVRDSYGCGDSFAAAFTYALASGATAAEAAALGARWGARALTHAGAP